MFEELESYYKENKASFDDEFRLRIHRALSWLKKSSLLKEDEDLRFVTLWIAFNAAYAKELTSGTTFDKQTFLAFITLICQVDKANLIQQNI